MLELSIAAIIFSIWTGFATKYYLKYRKTNSSNADKNGSFWKNEYLFDTIPSVFPTLGIFCTALGITMGIWHFDVNDIQGSIPELLKGLRLAFIATMLGILGLIAFQKWNALIQKKIDDDPNKPAKVSSELEGIQMLRTAVEEAKKTNDQFLNEISTKLDEKLGTEIAGMKKELSQRLDQTLKVISESNGLLKEGFSNVDGKLVKLHESNSQGQESILEQMRDAQTNLDKNFAGFSELLAKNNTEALVEVMRTVTEQFNSQMNELISKLVQENFSELNASVQSMNSWQQDNKEMIERLTSHFQKTTEMFELSSKTLNAVAEKSEALVASDGKLSEIIFSLDKILINDEKLVKATTMLLETTDSVKTSTESFEEMTTKLNEWVRTERNFKDSADVLILKLEEFRDINSDVWKRYREEMSSAVSIIKTTSERLGEDLTNVNEEFYQRLDETLSNLDLCIQRFVPAPRQ